MQVRCALSLVALVLVGYCANTTTVANTVVVTTSVVVSGLAPNGAASTSNKVTHSPIYTFNNGVVDATKSCPAREWSQIQSTMAAALSQTQKSNGRQLQLVRSRHSNRQLQRTKCESCHGKPLCLFQSGIGCAKKNGGGRKQRQRNLQQGKCSSGITAIDAALNTLKSSLSLSCQALLNAPRKIECTEFAWDCNIVGFTVLRNNGSVVTALNMTGTSSFCSSVGEVNIETITNFDMGTITTEFTSKGPSFFFQHSFGNYSPYLVFQKGKAMKLSPGTYTLKATATTTASSNTKETTFTVRSC